jgi:two-component system, OmpR family, KDP operon response regulator KdpE
MTSEAESTPPPLVLVVDDEPAIRKFLRVSLAAQSYRIVEAETARGALAHVATDRPDVLLLDLGLPDGDGVDVVRQIREWSSLPIIVISARGQERDKVAALDAGADDYLTKPFGVNELLARLRVALRHAAKRSSTADHDEPFVAGDLVVDLQKRLVTLGGTEVKLTPNEYKLLSVLVKNAGLVLTHQQLLREVWGPGSQTETHYLRVYVNQLRQKIAASPTDRGRITTIPGVGYRLGTGESGE